jgi:hypothetical protein
MTAEPVIAFGQQPCGFFPRRFLVAKIRTAPRLQVELGGRVVYSRSCAIARRASPRT